MFLRYLFLLCLCSPSLFAASFTLDVACTIKNIQFTNMKVEVDEHKPCVLALKDVNLDFKFSVLWYNKNKGTVAVQTTVTQRASENNQSVLLAQPIIVATFGHPATIICTEIKAQSGEKEITQLTLLAQKNN